MDFIPKAKIEIAAADEKVSSVIETIEQKAKTVKVRVRNRIQVTDAAPVCLGMKDAEHDLVDQAFEKHQLAQCTGTKPPPLRT